MNGVFMYEFYSRIYCGSALSEQDFLEYWNRAMDKLACYLRTYQVQCSEELFKMASCAMAEVLAYYDDARNGQGGMRYASVGTVSVSGKGIYSQVDVSPEAEERALYRAASTYLTIYRGLDRGGH